MSAQVYTPETAKYQQSVKAPTCQAQSREKHITKKGQAEKGDLNYQQPETGHNNRILQRKPEDAPQQAAATVTPAPATPAPTPQQAATPATNTSTCDTSTCSTAGCYTHTAGL